MNAEELGDSMEIGFHPVGVIPTKGIYLRLSFHTSALRIMLLARGKKAGVLAT
jgi:hypothetical protein